jgi:DinB superfamily
LQLCGKNNIMPAYNSTALLNDLQQQTESFLQKAISQWQMTDATLLGKQPAPGSWSAAQCLAHLNSYGDYYLPEIAKAIAAAKLNARKATGIFKTGWLGAYFTRLMLPDKSGQVKKKMQSPKPHRPAPDMDAHKAVADFISQQEQLLQLLEAARAVNLNKARVPISIARFIRLRLGDVLLFVVAHNSRHVLQAERGMRSS